MNQTKQTGKVRIGIPRALLYHKYHVLWEEFFRALGCTVLYSPQTNREILKNGVNLAVDESCLAMKIYLGHVNALAGSADYIFVPRVHSIEKDERLCTKFLAVTDIVRNTFEDTRVLSFMINADLHMTHERGLMSVGLKLTHNPVRVFRALRQAKKKYQEYRKEKKQKLILSIRKGKSKPTILIVSHSYVIHDAFLGLPIVKKLEEEGMNVVFADYEEGEDARIRCRKLSRDLYWTYNMELLGAIEQYKHKIDGIIFLMAFPCGPDSLVITLCQNKLAGIAHTVITLDELQADAGLKTRLESFVDIIQFRLAKQ